MLDKKMQRTLVLGALGALIAMPTLTACNWDLSSALKGGSSSDDGNVQLVADVKKAQQDLFVDPAKVASDFCTKLVGTTKLVTVNVNGKDVQTPQFDAGSTHDVVGSGTDGTLRLWSDAPNVPLTDLTVKGEQAVVCKDPGQAAQVMNQLGPIKIGDKSIAGGNSWMQAQGGIDQVKTWTKGCLTTDVDAHMSCAETMSYAATLLGKFQGMGVTRVAATSSNVHLADGVTVGEVPDFGMNPTQEVNAWFVVEQYTTKTCAVNVRFGFNVGRDVDVQANGGDQRVAILPPVDTCKPAPKATTPAPGTTAPTQPGTRTTPPTTRTTPPTTRTTPPTTPPSTPTPTPTPSRTSKNGDPSVQPTQPPSATGTNPPPVVVTHSGTPEPTSCASYDPTTGLPDC